MLFSLAIFLETNNTNTNNFSIFVIPRNLIIFSSKQTNKQPLFDFSGSFRRAGVQRGGEAGDIQDNGGDHAQRKHEVQTETEGRASRSRRNRR